MRGLAWDEMSPAEQAAEDAADEARDDVAVDDADDDCSRCGGSGGGPDAALRCPHCNGRGR